MNIYDAVVHSESRQFVGIYHWYRNIVLHYLYTEGIHWLKLKLDCHWLCDDIAILTRHFGLNEQFIVADFITQTEQKGKLVLNDGNDRLLHTEYYEYTDLFVNNSSNNSSMQHTLRLFYCYDHEAHAYIMMIPSEY